MFGFGKKGPELPSKDELARRAAETGANPDAFQIDDPAAGVEQGRVFTNKDIVLQAERKSGPADGDLDMESVDEWAGDPGIEPTDYSNEDIVQGRHTLEPDSAPAAGMEGIDAPDLVRSMEAKAAQDEESAPQQEAA
ncbi:MAG: hypothetical protein KC877_03915 [Candidatus Kaiserbacteria bacterium]|nr:hypothetical protein [Candidatus Kaiserbacteria bacterium]MCB9816379.1 hypothetical protein [Candidatus Nomurabacteria bacterium]